MIRMCMIDMYVFARANLKINFVKYSFYISIYFKKVILTLKIEFLKITFNFCKTRYF